MTYIHDVNFVKDGIAGMCEAAEAEKKGQYCDGNEGNAMIFIDRFHIDRVGLSFFP